MTTADIRAHADRVWRDSIVGELKRYIAIPNKSPGFDRDWAAHGHMERAVALIADWCRKQPLKGATVEIVRLPGRTPLLFVDVPGTGSDRVLLYGHYDKQPEFTGWLEGLGPWTPVIRDGRLYGRGGADDGYAAFSSLTAIAALQAAGIAHAPCVLIIEGCEESGSYDLPYYIEHLAARIGEPSLVVCLDAECGNYEQLWCTTSLRGNLTGTLSVGVLKEGVHSGMASGIAPSSFRILRQLLSRIEDEKSGDLLIEALHVPIPADRRRQARTTAELLGDEVFRKLPFVAGARPVSNDPVELLLGSTWLPTLVVTGADGLPALRDAGNVLLPEVSARLSLRLPPTADPAKVATAIKATLEANPPYGAAVQFEIDSSTGGWNAPVVAPWLEQSAERASQEIFGRAAMYMGVGGTIPFMGMLGERFPRTQFLITGVLGPQANAHGPNEFLHLEKASRLTACVALVIADHFGRQSD
ncbi:MAG TPA: M20 family metallopeptidase [Steroidobacteraceae bacterium]|nr:M20 family metallopeptidase [Steroidobacteraceae bacterium]